MTSSELVTLIGSLGFPIVIVLGLLWFARRDVWPWYTKFAAERVVAQDARHKDYIGTIARSTEAVEALLVLITKMDNRLEDHTRRLTIIEAAARAAAAAAGH